MTRSNGLGLIEKADMFIQSLVEPKWGRHMVGDRDMQAL
jgi:hypothetical protein